MSGNILFIHSVSYIHTYIYTVFIYATSDAQRAVKRKKMKDKITWKKMGSGRTPFITSVSAVLVSVPLKLNTKREVHFVVAHC